MRKTILATAIILCSIAPSEAQFIDFEAWFPVRPGQILSGAQGVVGAIAAQERQAEARRRAIVAEQQRQAERKRLSQTKAGRKRTGAPRRGSQEAEPNGIAARTRAGPSALDRSIMGGGGGSSGGPGSREFNDRATARSESHGPRRFDVRQPVGLDPVDRRTIIVNTMRSRGRLPAAVGLTLIGALVAATAYARADDSDQLWRHPPPIRNGPILRRRMRSAAIRCPARSGSA